MTKQDLLSTIETERAQLEKVIATLTAEQLTQVATLGEWSVKDILAHVAMWTARCVTLLYQAEQGQTPDEIDVISDNVDAENAADYASQKDRPLELVLADFRGAHRQLLKRLSAWTESDLADVRRFAWLRNQSMGEYLNAEIAEHDAEHRQQIEALLGG